MSCNSVSQNEYGYDYQEKDKIFQHSNETNKKYSINFKTKK